MRCIIDIVHVSVHGQTEAAYYRPKERETARTSEGTYGGASSILRIWGLGGKEPISILSSKSFICQQCHVRRKRSVVRPRPREAGLKELGVRH